MMAIPPVKTDSRFGKRIRVNANEIIHINKKKANGVGDPEYSASLFVFKVLLKLIDLHIPYYNIKLNLELYLYNN